MDVIDLNNYSERIIHETSVDFIKRIIQNPIHIMQYDNNLPIVAAKLYKNGQSYVLPDTAVVKIRWCKKDHTFIYKAVLGCSAAKDTVYFEIDNQMTYYDGLVQPILEVTVGNKLAGSSYMYFEIDRNPIQNSDIESHSEYPDLVEAVARAEQASVEAQAAAEEAIEAAEQIEALTSQVNANTAAIAGIKDGTSIDSFSDVEGALADKQNTLTTDNTINLVNDEISVNTNVIATKDYVDNSFATTAEMTIMLEEVFS